MRNPRAPSSDGSRRFTSDRAPAHENLARAAPTETDDRVAIRGGARRAPVHVFVEQHPCPRFQGGGELVEQGLKRRQKPSPPSAPDKSKHPAAVDQSRGHGGGLPAGPGPLRPARPSGGLTVGGAEALQGQKTRPAGSHLAGELQALTNPGTCPRSSTPFTCRQTGLPRLLGGGKSPRARAGWLRRCFSAASVPST